MTCPHCGSSAPVVGGMCTVCHAALGSRSGAATATLTPPAGSRAGGPGLTVPIDAHRPLAAGTNFGPRYRIVKLLGAGGMGIVYQAWDEELGVAVALKVIRPEAIQDPAAAHDVEQRFKRELLLARRVTHHNVVRIHDIGEVDGIKYISMPFIEGCDLATRLSGTARLPLAEALDLTRQIAEGLRAAHAAGVAHRDLKPENVMVDGDGRAVIMDFGISRSTSLAAATQTMTATGAIVGTLEYMSPEQARGEHVDHRSDIYALGLILHDMLAGRERLTAAGSAVAELMDRMQTPARALTLPANTPEGVSRIIARCVSADPAKRYQSAGELLSELDLLGHDGQPLPKPRVFSMRVVLAGAVVFSILLAAAIGLTVWRWRAAPPAMVAREPVSVLIANFENRAEEPLFEGVLEQALGIGMEGASFIGAYPRAEALRVLRQIAPGQALDLGHSLALARREGIKIVLAGSIEPPNPGYRIAVRIIDAMPDRELGRVEANAGSKTEVLQAIGTLASGLRSGLGDTTPESARLAAAETFTSTSLEAARDFSEAQLLASAGKDEEAVAHYRAAIARDANFGRAYAAWGVSAWKLGRTEESAEAYRKAFPLMDRMTDREKYRTMGTYYLTITRNYEKAVENYTNLVKLYPADRAGHSNLALAQFYVLNFPKALEEGRAAVTLYPKNVTFRNNVALYAMYASDFGTAVAEAKQVIEQDPAFFKAYLPLAMAALAGGDPAAARKAYGGMAEAGARGRSYANAGLADIAAYAGQYPEAVGILEQGIAADQSAKATAQLASKYVALAEAYHALGQEARAAEAAASAAKLVTDESVSFPVARLALARGRDREARALAEALQRQLQTKPRAYGKLIEGEIALHSGRTADAVQAFRDAQHLADVWTARFDLGVAYVTAGSHAEGLAELDACVARIGEATSVFLDEVPTFRYTVPVHYWRARALEGLGMTAKAAESFRLFLSHLPASSTDPLAADARRRLNGV